METKKILGYGLAVIILSSMALRLQIFFLYISLGLGICFVVDHIINRNKKPYKDNIEYSFRS